MNGTMFKIALLILMASMLLPGSTRAAVSRQELIQKAQAAESQGYLNLAIHYYTHALKSNSDDQARRALARLKQKAGHKALAEIDWRKILESSPKDSEALAALASLGLPGEVSAEDAALDALQPPAKSDMLWTKGHGAWLFGEPRQWVKPLNDYNLAAPRTQRIKYVFPVSGSLGFNGGSAILNWNPDRALILADSLAGEARVYPMIDGKTGGIASILEKEWDRVGKEIADKINADERIAGVMFDIVPHDNKLHALYARVKKYSTKPVGTALSVWEKNTFKFVDLVVLRAFDHTLRPSDYAATVRDQIRGFLRDARDAKTQVLVGAPAVATHQEYEGAVVDPTQTPAGSGFKMPEYVDALQRAVRQALVTDDPSFLGLSIWALHPEGGIHEPGDQLWYFPSMIAPAMWDMFKLPLAAEEQ